MTSRYNFGEVQVADTIRTYEPKNYTLVIATKLKVVLKCTCIEPQEVAHASLAGELTAGGRARRGISYRIDLRRY